VTNAEALLAQAVNLIGERAASQPTLESNRIDLIVEPAQLLECVAPLTTTHWGYLSAISGLDHGSETGRLEVLYFFCNQAAVLTLRVPVPREAPRVPSICGLIPSATLFERELMEMFGVVCEGTPNSERLFLPDDWPDGTYPLRKDFIVPAPPAAPEE
jgi:Ni,Fe-hydrogenase III component G